MFVVFVVQIILEIKPASGLYTYTVTRESASRSEKLDNTAVFCCIVSILHGPIAN